MGGYGSGRHYYSARQTVEDSLKLDSYHLLPNIIKESGGGYYSGLLSWSRNGEQFSSVSYILDEHVFKLSYTKDKTVHVNCPVPLVTTCQPNGGLRYWFLCPLDGCTRKTAKLYMPAGAKYFGCRSCYNLTYQSCNESHKYDTFFWSMGCRNAKEARRMLLC